MNTYRCGNCMNPCQPELHEVGIVADCCEEAIVLVEDACEIRALTRDEETDLIEELAADEWHELTPHQKARSRWLGNS